MFVKHALKPAELTALGRDYTTGMAIINASRACAEFGEHRIEHACPLRGPDSSEWNKEPFFVVYRMSQGVEIRKMAVKRRGL